MEPGPGPGPAPGLAGSDRRALQTGPAAGPLSARLSAAAAAVIGTGPNGLGAGAATARRGRAAGPRTVTASALGSIDLDGSTAPPRPGSDPGGVARG